MTWQDILLIVETTAILKICLDDNAMLKIARESLEVQKQYLAIRRKWYEARAKKVAGD
jgi:hypothetical protein